MNGADVIAEILKREGTDFLACYPRNPLIDACAEIDIRPILCRQERVGVGMADGFSPHPPRQAERRVRRPARRRHRERLSRASRRPIPRTCRCWSFPAASPSERQYIRPTFRAAEVFRPVTKWSALATTGAGIARLSCAAPFRRCAAASPARCWSRCTTRCSRRHSRASSTTRRCR